MVFADLHLHSTASDGLLDPAAVVAEAQKKRLSAIALTDHDTTGGLEEAFKEASRDNALKIISGLEMSCEDKKGTEVHILGYKIDRRHAGLQQLLNTIKNSRRQRLKGIIQRLNENGFNLSWDKLAPTIKGVESPGRPHIARLMVEGGFIATVAEAFEKWLSPGCPAYVPRYKLAPCQGIRAIQEAGGLAFLAHPGLVVTEDLAGLIADWNLDGIEVYHPSHESRQVKEYLHLADDLKLLISGGSDFHGAPGETVGAVAIDMSLTPWLLD